MSKVSPLTPEELAMIAAGREAARKRAQQLIDDADPAEDAAIMAAAESDPDALPMTDEQLARMHPAHEVIPQVVAAQLRGRGRPKADAPKRQVTLRLDAEVIEHFQAMGKGWRSRINDELRSAVRRS